MGLIREPDGVDFIVSEGHLDREAILDIADWLNAYRREHDQSAELESALKIIRQAEERKQSNVGKDSPRK